jgi:hypothetical protein
LSELRANDLLTQMKLVRGSDQDQRIFLV